MALDVLPHEIPLDGQRYDLTLRKTGFGKGIHTAKYVIDNGDKRGHIISGKITAEMHTMLADAVSMIEQGPDVSTEIDAPSFHVILNRNAKSIRCSAIVHVTYLAAINEQLVEVEPDYRESNVMVTYELSDFNAPEHESEITSIFKGKV